MFSSGPFWQGMPSLSRSQEKAAKQKYNRACQQIRGQEPEKRCQKGFFRIFVKLLPKMQVCVEIMVYSIVKHAGCYGEREKDS